MKKYPLTLIWVVVFQPLIAQNYFTEAKKIQKIIYKINEKGLDNERLLKATKDFIARSTPNRDAFTTAPKPGEVTAPNPKPNNASEPTVDEAVLKNEIAMIFALRDSACHEFENFPPSFTQLDNIYNAGIAGEGNAAFGKGGFAFSESAIIYGITDFVIKRAREELLEVYLNDWYNKLNSDDIIRPLIPQTLSVYKAFRDDHSLNLSKYGDKWKNAFQEDFRNFPVQLQDEGYLEIIFNQLKIKDDLKHELIPLIAGGDELIYNLYLKKHLVNVLSAMSGKYLSETENERPAIFKRLVLFADIVTSVSGSMVNNTNYQPVKLEEINTMTIGDWKILLKLIYARKKESMVRVTGNDVTKFCQLINEPSKFQELAAQLKDGVTILSSYQEILSGSNSNMVSTKQLSGDETRKLFDLTFQLLQLTNDFLILVNAPINLDLMVNKITPYFSALSEIGEGISGREYGKVLDGSLAIISKTAAFSDSNNAASETIKNLQRYGSFMINILTAKDGEAVETSLDELIPKGQYHLKNTNKFTVSLSAYPGLFVGAESIKKYQVNSSGTIDYTKEKKSATAFSLAPYLPIGIDFSWGAGKHHNSGINKSPSNNFFVQLLDLGAVLNYRISSDSTVNNNPEISFEQILSPGFAYMRHLSNSPLVFGAGINYTPDLRKVTQEGTSYSENAFRFGIFVAVDVTGLILYTSKRGN